MSTKKLFSTDKTDEMKRVLTLFSLTATRCRACQRAQDVKNNAGHGARQKRSFWKCPYETRNGSNSEGLAPLQYQSIGNLQHRGVLQKL